VTHARTVTLTSKPKHPGARTVRGVVTVADGAASCMGARPVKLQRRSGSSWATITTKTTLTDGTFSVAARFRAASYRVQAPAVVVGTDPADVCATANSVSFRVT
jgi:hypothetical protein